MPEMPVIYQILNQTISKVYHIIQVKYTKNIQILKMMTRALVIVLTKMLQKNLADF